jgi:hypothetical protein
MNVAPANPSTKTSAILACISFTLLAVGFFFFFDVFWTWLHIDNDAPVATGCGITGALLSIVSLITRRGAGVFHWIILGIYVLMVAAVIYFMMTWKMTRLF